MEIGARSKGKQAKIVKFQMFNLDATYPHPNQVHSSNHVKNRSMEKWVKTKSTRNLPQKVGEGDRGCNIWVRMGKGNLDRVYSKCW